MIDDALDTTLIGLGLIVVAVGCAVGMTGATVALYLSARKVFS